MNPDSRKERELRHAMSVLADTDTTVPLDNYHLKPQPPGYGIWGVFEGTDDDAELIDILRVQEFRSARELLGYLRRINESRETTHGDVTAPEVA